MFSAFITTIVIHSYGFMTVSFYENLTIGLYHVNWTNMNDISKQVFKDKNFYLIILFKTFKSSFKKNLNRIIFTHIFLNL
jgi:hypothetical protein